MKCRMSGFACVSVKSFEQVDWTGREGRGLEGRGMEGKGTALLSIHSLNNGGEWKGKDVTG